MSPPPVGRIVSGGQTGVDRAALDVALALGLPCGGWCPRGGWAEDMPDPPGLLASYPTLNETPSTDPVQRTRWNVRDSDAVLLVLPARGAASPGSALTLAHALELRRPLAAVTLQEPSRALAEARALLSELPRSGSLNVAGPRESESPEIYRGAAALLASLLGEAPV